MAQKFVQVTTRHLAKPVIKASEEREDRTKRQHIMEVRDNIICVVKIVVETAVGEHNTRHATNGEHEDEAHCPNHWRFEAD